MPYTDNNGLSPKPTPEAADSTIRERAYLLWEAEGCPENRAGEYWNRARELVEDEGQSAYPPAQSQRYRT